MGGTRKQKQLIINSSPNGKLVESGDICLILEIRLLEEGGSGICGNVVADRARF